MNWRTLVDQGRGQQAVSRGPVFLPFANWVRLFPRQAAYGSQQPFNLANLNLRIAGLGFQGIQHQAGKQPVPDLPAGSWLVEQVEGDDLLADGNG